MSWLKKAWNSIKKVTKSPIFHVVEGGLALAFPAVAISAHAALSMGNKALAMANSSNKVVAAKYRAVIENTEKLASQGHPDAIRAVQAMKLAKDAKAGNPSAMAEVNRIRSHAGHQRLAAQAVMRRFTMHRKTGVVSLKPL
jgi:hypothetical protein